MVSDGLPKAKHVDFRPDTVDTNAFRRLCHRTSKIERQAQLSRGKLQRVLESQHSVKHHYTACLDFHRPDPRPGRS